VTQHLSLCRYYITYHQWNSKPEFIVATHKVVNYKDVLDQSNKPTQVPASPYLRNQITLSKEITLFPCCFVRIHPYTPLIPKICKATGENQERVMQYADPHQSGKLYPDSDPDQHQSEKQDPDPNPDPQQSGKMYPDLHQSEERSRIRINVMRIGTVRNNWSQGM
jgi:hypothetical protein